MINIITETPYDLQVEHYNGNILSINTGTPRLSWKYTNDTLKSGSVELEITRNMPGEERKTKFIKIRMDDNVLYNWPFDPLSSGEQVQVKIRLVNGNAESAWSKPLLFEVGILEYWDLMGKFVGPSWFEGETDHRHLPLIRTEFKISKKPVYARLYLSSLGLVEGVINGKKIGEDVLTPGWTCYDNRLEVWTFDMTDDIKLGDNALGFYLGDGWYRGRIGFKGGKANVYGDKIAVYSQLKIVYDDGTSEEIVSNSADNQWKAIKGPIIQSDLCEGETYDSRIELEGWDNSGFDDSGWSAVAEVPYDTRKMEFPVLPPVRCNIKNEAFNITKIGEHDGKTDWQIDFGQNSSQRMRIHILHSQDGDVLRLQHAEILENDGTLCTTPLRRGQQIDEYISNGKEDYFEAKFAMHGFRYAEIRGWRGELTSEDIESRVYYSDLKRTGWLNTSNERVNRLHENVLWSLRSNFVSVPTDCPQRDERLGWTGDISVFSNTAAYLYDVSGFLSSWMDDVKHEQKSWGTVPFYVPFVPLAEWTNPKAIAVWGDAAVRVPWSIYIETGDKEVLAGQYSTAEAWINEVKGYLSKDGVWDKKPDYSLGQLADWLDPTAPADNPVQAMTEKELVATAFYAKSIALFIRINSELGKDTTALRDLYEHVSRGFLKRFFKEDGKMTSDTQSAYSLAISFGLLDGTPTLKYTAGERLAELVRMSGGKISTGFAGTPYVLSALTDTNHISEAYELFLSDKCPSWMYQVKMGATTTWERWDAMLPDGTVNPEAVTSFNHYALGSVAEWMHKTIGGLEPLEPGWRKFRIAPRPGGDLTEASAEYETPYGRTSVNWVLDKEIMTIKGNVPVGTIAEIDVNGFRETIIEPGEFNRTFVYKK